MANGELKIESGIPMPSMRGRRASPFTELLAAMQVGDSVFIADKAPDQIRRNVFSWKRYNKRTEKFAVGIVSGGTRIWRTK